MRKFFYAILFFPLIFLQTTFPTAAEEFKTFRTGYATIYYLSEKDLKQFFWRISGREIDIHIYPGLAKNRVDRIVEKVQAILDMYPERFHIDIYLYPKYTEGHVAFYSKKRKSITAYADKITDGVLAHEISHAVINSYFKSPPPEKVREILSQYVDRHLWAE